MTNVFGGTLNLTQLICSLEAQLVQMSTTHSPSGAGSISKVGEAQIPARIAGNFFYCPPLFLGAPHDGALIKCRAQ